MKSQEMARNMASALAALSAKPPKWQVRPASGMQDKEWFFVIPDIGLRVRLSRRARGEQRYAGRGEYENLPPGYLLQVTDADGGSVLIDGKYRRSFLGDVLLDKAKERATAILIRDLTNMVNALAPEGSAPSRLDLQERRAVDAVLMLMANGGWDAAHQPAARKRLTIMTKVEFNELANPEWKRSFLENARRQLEGALRR